MLDYAGNIARHAPLDELWETRKSPQRVAQDERDAQAAEEAARREQRDRHLRQASLLDPLTGAPPDACTYPVLGVTYEVRPSKNAHYQGKNLLVARYHTPQRKVMRPQLPPYLWQWICIEYHGWAQRQAEQWFARRGVPIAPRTAEEARIQAERLPRPTSLLVQERDFPEIMIEYFAEEEG